MLILKKWIPLWTIPTLIFFSIGTVWLRLAIVRTTYDINQTSRMIQNSRKNRENLELKLAALRSPQRMEVLARKKFKLSQPSTEQIVHLRKSENESDGG